MKYFRKYANRRLYCLQNNVYVTLNDIFEDVQAGHEVNVTHKDTKVDMTRETLLDVLVAQETKNPRLDIASLLELIRR